MNTTMRILRTPVTRLVRGQMGPAPKVDEWAATAELPDDLRDLVRRVVRRARLKRRERIDVAIELAAHFTDALAAGETPESAARAFGDEELAAKLIRRAVIRKRPLLWHTMRAVRWTAAAILALYVASGAYFLSGRPTVSVDYIAKINATTGTSSPDRAWPAYRPALIALNRDDDDAASRSPSAATKHRQWLSETLAAKEGSPQFSDLRTYLSQHATTIESLQRAASMPTLGFVIGSRGDANDPTLFSFNHMTSAITEEPSLVSVLLPHLNSLSQAAVVLEADARVARADGDAARFMASFEALLGMSQQMSGKGHPFVTYFIGDRIRQRAQRLIGDALFADPDLLSDEHLARAAHAMAGPRSVADMLDLTFEYYIWLDVVQRCYTDDASGDGRLTPEGLQYLIGITRPSDTRILSQAQFIRLASGLGPLSASRREVVAVFDRHLREYEARFTKPYRDVVNLKANAGSDEIRRSSLQSARYLPVSIFASALDRSHWNAERSLVRRDALTVAIAVELHRRRTGQYPATLSEIPRELLPSIPADPFVGGQIHYRLVNDRPVVYSVGSDRDDDHGRSALLRGTDPDPAASEWATGNRQAPDGDWILWPAARSKDDN